jgi:uncharacterized membrane protein YkvA (DUF1232 family)
MKRLSPATIILGALIYIASPVDVLPDMLGPAGRLDDLLIAAYLIYQALKRRPSPNQSRSDAASDTPERTRAQGAKDPYAVFNVPRTATAEEINERYRELMKQYHPDRVANLGKELRDLAHEKSIEIQAAYDQLVPNRAASNRP